MRDLLRPTRASNFIVGLQLPAYGVAFPARTAEHIQLFEHPCHLYNLGSDADNLPAKFQINFLVDHV